MSRSNRDRIPDEILKEIFPRKLSRYQSPDRVYTQLKKMILSGKLKKGKKLLREEIARNFNVSETVVAKAFSQLKKDRLIIIKGRTGSFII
jgi:DNA-binding GntR family transcriptional regulator